MQLIVLVIGATGSQTVKQLEVLQLKWRQFEPKVILLAVGWYLRFSLSYRGCSCRTVLKS
jgi:transposase-like protein